MLFELTECTVLMLKVIHDMYLRQKISFNEFLSYTETKLRFLSENISFIDSEADKEKAYDIIRKCNSLISSEECINLNYLQ
jgi:hypothetical protein